MDQPPGSSETRSLILSYERALAARDATGLGLSLADLLAPDFIEFGTSG